MRSAPQPRPESQPRPRGRHRRPAPPRAQALGRRGATVLAATAVALPLSAVSAADALASPAVPAVSCAVIGMGAHGATVAAIQRLVGATPDGAYGPLTTAAVRTWQQRHHLPATGTFDAASWAAAPTIAAGSCSPTQPTATTPSHTCAAIGMGAHGATVAAIQRLVGATPDGAYGPLTTAAVRTWQQRHHLPATGTFDAASWAAAQDPTCNAALLGLTAPVKATIGTGVSPVSSGTGTTVTGQQARATQVAAQVTAEVRALAGQPDRASSAPAAVTFARAQLGVPYVYGGTTRAGYDCSGLMLASYASLGIAINRTAAAQYAGGQLVPLSDLRPGDIVFYATNVLDPATTYHDAIYVGHGQMIEAAHSGVPVRLTALRATGLLPNAARPAALLTLPAARGTRGLTARSIQTRLVAHGQRISVDGVFGPATAAAVTAVQRAAQLPATGVVDSATWDVLAQ